MRKRLQISARRSVRQGFTILELMLVLAVLVSLSALVWPIIQGAFGGYRLRSAADQVRAAWGKAHIAAMNSGHPYLFRCQPQSGEYVVQPWTGAAADADAETEASATGMDPFVQCDADGNPIVRRLPDDVIFNSGDTENDTRSQNITESDEGTQSVSGNWAPPILFFADGSTSDAQVQIMNKDGRILTLELRGLNGASRVVDDEQEAPQQAPQEAPP